MTTTYTIQMTDSETPAAWMSLPGVTFRAGAQGDGKARYTATTDDAATLEAALEADEEVISYQQA